MKGFATRGLASFALLSITVIWGWTFVLIKEGMTLVGPLTFLALRFALAFLSLVLLLFRSLRGINRRALLCGGMVGGTLFLGYFFQTWGLAITTATKSGLITGLSVVIVPVLAAVLLKERVRLSLWLGVLSAAGGLALLVLGKRTLTAFNVGDLLTLFCALFFAGHILLVDRFIRVVDYRHLLLVQVGTVALLSLIGALFVEGFTFVSSPKLIEGVLVTGLLATALALYILNRFQTHSTASYTAIILTMEPIFAGLFGFLLLGETLSLFQLMGGGLILVGMGIPSFLVRGVSSSGG
jgi:drug/metabolite transporter (DMT)-like permease